MKKRYTAKKMLCLFLCVITCCSVISAYPAAASDTLPDMDYSAEGEEKVSVSPSEILKRLYPDTVSDEEAAYADRYFDTVLLYSDNVCPSSVEVEIQDENIRVFATPKIYEAQNGSTVKWIPVRAICAEQTAALIKDGDRYSCLISAPDANFVSVEYECEIELPEDYALALANFAFNDKQTAKRISSEYEQASTEYLSYLKKLHEYTDDLAAYEEYLEKKAVYDEALTKYNAYLSAFAAYEKEIKAYEKYLAAMVTYKSEKEAYEKAYAENTAEYEEYKKYLANLQAVRTATYALESMFVRPDNGVGTLYNALQNKELVAMIEKYDDELVTLYGVERENINVMRDVSDELNELLGGYNEAREESERAAFEFYRDNYAEICEKFNYLYDKMTSVLTDTIYIHVCALIEVEYKSDKEMATYKKWRIRNVLCHVYLICHVLDDSVTAPEAWDFYSETGESISYNFGDLLGQNVILTDTDNASPEGIEWWEGEVPATDLPKAPKKPAEVKEPSAPLEVKKPTAPQQVSDPGEPPAAVFPPSFGENSADFQVYLRAEHYLSDVTTVSRELPSDLALTFKRVVERPFASEPLTAYYSHDGRILSINSVPQAPVRESSEQYDYTFDGWSETVCDNGDVFYMPRFTQSARTYSVSFEHSSGEVICADEYEYGETPVFNGEVPTKESTTDTVYSFAGWSPQITPVTADASYIATFTQTERLYSVSWSILGKTVTRELSYGELPTPPAVRSETFIGGTLYTFDGWDKTPVKVTGNAEYTAKFTQKELVKIEGSDELSVYASENDYVITTSADKVEAFNLIRTAAADGRNIRVTSNGVTVTVPNSTVVNLSNLGTATLAFTRSENGVGYNFTKSNGSAVRFSGDVWMSLPCAEDQALNPFVLANGKTRLSCTALGNTVEFKAKNGTSYAVSRYYTLTVKHGDGGAVFCPLDLYPAGSLLELEFFPNAEFAVSKITLTDKDGHSVELPVSGEIFMPAYDATLSVEFDVKKYEIRFMSGGELIDTHYYALGETVVAPEIPLTFEKDGFIYTFIGWSKPLGLVMGNDTYTAKYYSVRIEDAPVPEDQTALETVLIRHVLPVVIVLVGIGAAITVTVIIVRKKTKKKSVE